MDKLKTYPHFQQSREKRNCGAACVCMLLNHYGMRGKLCDITDEVSLVQPNGIEICRNDLMAKCAIRRGLKCSVVSAKDIGTFLPFCQEQGIDTIVLYHQKTDGNFGHFSVVTNVIGNEVYLNDPDIAAPAGINACMQINDLKDKMICHGIGDEIAKSNTVILISRADDEKGASVVGSTYVPLVFPSVRDKVNLVLDLNVTDPNTDPWCPVDELSQD